MNEPEVSRVLSNANPVETLVGWSLHAQMVLAALRTFAELSVADRMSTSEEKTAEELARELGCSAPHLGRLLRVVSISGVVRESNTGRFLLTPTGEFVRSDRPGSARDFVRFILAPYRERVLENLTESVRAGDTAFLRTYGEPVFDYLSNHADLLATFQAAMTSFTVGVARAMATVYPFDEVRSVADIGGGEGTLLTVLLQERPSLRGILYDLPGVVARGSERIRSAGLVARCQCIGGSFFDSVPPGADVYILKSIIHDWDDGQSLVILGRTRDAMRPDSRLLLVEVVAPSVPGPSFAYASDLNMMMFTGGKERTVEEYRMLLRQANLHLTTVRPIDGVHSIVESRPMDPGPGG